MTSHFKAYTLREVKSKQDAKEFIRFPAALYANDPNYIRPWNSDIRKVFDPKQNRFYTEGKVIRWLLYNSMGVTVGRIAAFINPKTAYSERQPTGGVGFFDCINSVEAAHVLFNAAKEWLTSQGMEAMDGPVNLGERDNWWGVLVDGFSPPSYGMNYNAPYYQALYESYGFKNYFNQYSYLRSIAWENLSGSLFTMAEQVAANPSYRFSTISKKRMGKAADDFCYIYNKAWVLHDNIAPMTPAHARKIVDSMKMIIDERLIFFAYYNEEPIGFFIQIPEINQAIKHLNGKSSLFHKLKFVYLLKRKKVCTRILGLVFGIIPEFRGKGVEGAMVMKFAEVAFQKNFPYKDIELCWVGDFNPMMMRFQVQIGGYIHKTHVTYRLYFDKEKQENGFQRAPRMGRQQGKGKKLD